MNSLSDGEIYRRYRALNSRPQLLKIADISGKNSNPLVLEPIEGEGLPHNFWPYFHLPAAEMKDRFSGALMKPRLVVR